MSEFNMFGGWGDPTKSDAKNLLAEAKRIDALHAETGVVCSVADAKNTLSAKLEARIKTFFHFDEGWDFMVAERLAYNLTAEETMMIVQLIGNCVGASHCALLAARIAQEICAGVDGESPLGLKQLAQPFIPYSYGMGRLEGNMLGGGDGSYCGAQMAGTLKHGFLPCDTPGLDAYGGTLPQSTANANRLFGRSRSELMKWEDKAIGFKLSEAPRAKSANDVKVGIVEKKIPFQICSGQGFVYKGFDAKYGVHLYTFGGRWSHSMQLVACFCIKGQWFAVIRNQWGQDKHKGSPEIGIAGGCMVITLEMLDKWIKSAEVMGIGEITGKREQLAA